MLADSVAAAVQQGTSTLSLACAVGPHTPTDLHILMELPPDSQLKELVSGGLIDFSLCCLLFPVLCHVAIALLLVSVCSALAWDTKLIPLDASFFDKYKIPRTDKQMTRPRFVMSHLLLRH